MRRAAAALLNLLVLTGCGREEATARLKDDLPASTIDVIHARFPCRSPDLHFFGYRFRIGVKGEFSEGEICWNFSTRPMARETQAIAGGSLPSVQEL
jgi:hypothetical protein